ncbi:hypothetical protein SAMN04487928_12912 [Butyrivibrio proteoclasticus]|uniref:ApeA N-terminal domain-containing protein n=1 Tax=Butyrivibrio proteoclasticus TaxID=43305 RepID=A0A1I5X7N9_9FIRM|nr:hypothetical protein [Butyrivibrio proteoclasticus]SFQ28009.1 hypothetical protein SAMN04487928_12912 [Butyrivibrio proteoclasticus]
MNEMIVTTRHKVFVNNPVQEFSSKIDNSTVFVGSKGDKLIVRIHTRKNENNTKHLFFDIFSIMYICLGAFPTIENVTFNGCNLDTAQLAKKYYTRKTLFRDDLRIANICSQTINQTIIDNYRKKQHEPISSLQYLDSAGYETVVTDHRITLLLHIIDGICDVSDKVLTAAKAEVVNRYKPNNNPGDYLCKVYLVSKDGFFNYHRQYNCGILKLMHIKQYDFLSMLSDTRNWNSHFLNNKKPNRIKDGAKIVIFFEIVHYMIRIKIAKDIGIELVKENIQEYYYTVHDWILEILYGRDDALKSSTYMTNKKKKAFQKAIQDYLNSIQTTKMINGYDL